MTDSTSTFLAIVFGLGVFAVIVAVGWRSVQNRRILRLQGGNGQETIIVAREGDDISSVVTTTETAHQAPASTVAVGNGVVDPAPEPEFGRRAIGSRTAVDGESGLSGCDFVGRTASSTD